MAVEYFVAWWNLENLFDEENAPPDRRPDKVQRAIGGELRGWTPAVRDRKIDQLASVIAQMNNGAGPDLLGICEVENRFVIDLLLDNLAARLGRTRYAVVHADSQDRRAIDVAFIYDDTLFDVPADAVFHHVVMRRNATREIVQVNFQTRHGNRTWAVFGNHWPSRSGGQYESAGYRQIAGETLAYFHQRVLEVHGTDTPVLAMGDFNDEPFDTSLVTHALSERQHNRVVNARNPTLLNLMWPLIGGHRQGPAPHREPDGTFYYSNEPNMLDQFLANKHMITGSAPIRVDEASVEIVRFPGMFSERSDYPAPILFGRPPETNHSPDGYSDHFPISMRITEQ